MTFENKFAAFSRRDLVYSAINGLDIMVTAMIPSKLQDLPAGKYPILIHWHGGGFLTGLWVHAPWWPEWFLELALQHNALIISPDHRLVPEATGTEILSDISAFNTWLSSEAWHATPDLSRLAAIGASSGGYMALHMALLLREKLDVKAAMTVCSPLNDISSGTLVPRGPRRILGSMPPPPREAELLIRGYIKKIRPGGVRTEGDPANMWPILLSAARFYINLPFGGLIAVMLAFVRIPEPIPKPSPISVLRCLPSKLDLIGFAIFAPAAIMLLLALQYGGVTFAWDSSEVVGLFCGAAATFIFFLIWDKYKGDDAMIPFSMARRMNVWSSCLVYGLLMGQLFCASYYLPIYFHGVRGVSPTMSGVYLLPSILSHILAAVSSRILRMFNYLEERVSSFAVARPERATVPVRGLCIFVRHREANEAALEFCSWETWTSIK